MIKAVFLDAGGTLLTPFPSVGGVYARVAARHGVNASAETLDAAFKTAWKKHRETRQPVDKPWWKQVVAAVFEDQPVDNFEKLFEDVYAEFERKDAWRVFDDVFPTLDGLRQRSMRLAIVSNWDSRLPALLDTLGLAKYFERQFVSFGMGVAKPDPLLFKRALEQMELSAAEVIHVGDDIEEDVKGAEAAGIRAYHLDRRARPLNSRMMVSLDEIFVRI
jgi:putative hydrolase of the HAD superfamily